jgi:F420-non-reducing hydrogenase iron-sulfur subunit
MRLVYPTSIRIIRVPCTGKVDALHIMRAFEKGADGVYLVGCREGDCHFERGNFRAKARVEELKKLLDTLGIGGDRLMMYNLSSSDGPMFARYAQEMHERILSLGPSPIRLALRRLKGKERVEGRTAQAVI